MKAIVTVMLKDGVLDPQGKAIGQALRGLGFAGTGLVRAGKVIEIELAEPVAAADADPAAPAAEPLARAVEQHVAHVLAAHRDGLAGGGIYDQVLAEVERPLIQMILSATRGNQIKAAELLGLNRNTLRKKIRDHAIQVLRGVS
jgi:two-component system nitrogen regulation response regulator GlnG